MGYERTHLFQQKNSHTPQPTNRFASRPFAAPVQRKPQSKMTPDELEKEAFKQNKFEAFGLQLKEQSGTITPVEQERLGVLQAKMDDFWAQREERASRFGYDFSKVSVTPREAQPTPKLQPWWLQRKDGVAMDAESQEMNSPQRLSALPIQAKMTIGEPGDKYEQEADALAARAVEQIHAPATAQPTPGPSVQRLSKDEATEEAQGHPEISALQRTEEDGEKEEQSPGSRGDRVVQCAKFGKKSHIAVGSAIGTVIPVIGNIVGGLIGYGIYRNKRRRKKQHGRERAATIEGTQPAWMDGGNTPPNEELSAFKGQPEEDDVKIDQGQVEQEPHKSTNPFGEETQEEDTRPRRSSVVAPIP